MSCDDCRLRTLSQLRELALIKLTQDDAVYLRPVNRMITVMYYCCSCDCVLWRLTLPNDANLYGNVHGGTILKLIEDTGTIIATRYCNRAAPQTEVYLSQLTHL